MEYINYTTKELMEIVDYGLKAANEMRARDNNEAAYETTKMACHIMDEIMRRQASIEI